MLLKGKFQKGQLLLLEGKFSSRKVAMWLDVKKVRIDVV